MALGYDQPSATYTARSLAEVVEHFEAKANEAKASIGRATTVKDRRFREGEHSALVGVVWILRSLKIEPERDPMTNAAGAMTIEGYRARSLAEEKTDGQK